MIRPIILAIAATLACGAAAAEDSTEYVKRAQERLKVLGFYSGPVNGDFGPATQAALAQFQLSVPIPASGQIDVETALELGIARDASAEASAAGGASADPRGGSRATPENPNASGG